MATKYYDRVQMSVTGTPGTGDCTLNAAVTNYQTFAAAGANDGDQFPYLITDGSAWEIGVGTYHSSGPSISRTTRNQSSTGSAISFTSTAVVTATFRAEDVVSGGGGSVSLDLLMDSKTVGVKVSQKNEYQDVAAGATVTVIDYIGEGYVDQFFFAWLLSDPNTFDNSTIKIYRDGSSTPDISMPLLRFIPAVYMRGSSTPNSAYGNRFFGVNSESSSTICGYSRLPIPFSTHIKITIDNGGSSSGRLWTTSSIQTGVPNTWARTRRLRAASLYLASASANSIQTLLNVVPGAAGRLAGLWLLVDDYPGSLSPLGAELEGNFTLYADVATAVWSATTALALGVKIIDGNGNVQTVTTAGTTGSSAPTFGVSAGSTTADGSVVWTATLGAPNQTWVPSAGYALHMSLIDSAGNVQLCTTAGTAGSSAPSWNATTGGTTTDGSVTWTNQGSTFQVPSYQTSGAEDYFMMGFYGGGVPPCWTSDGDIGTTFCSTGGAGTVMSPSTLTRSFYRFHIDDPIVFGNSLALLWQCGDTSQVAWSSGTARVYMTAWYYEET